VKQPDIHIRTATLEDAGLLAELGARTFRDTFGQDEPASHAADFSSLAFTPAVKSGDLADPQAVFLIADADGAAVGYAKLRFGYAPFEVEASAPMEIARFFADSPWIGRGVGAALMTACLALAHERHCDIVWLDVRDGDTRAAAFYSKWSFEIVANRAPGWVTMALSARVG
jgi:diamine N-acetyltransferase